MQYLTGLLAFGIPCDLDTNGMWGFRSSDYSNDEHFATFLRDSDNSPFKEVGIVNNVYIDQRPLCTYRVANHVRAYLDMLYEGKFDELKGLYQVAIGRPKYRQDIFMQVYGKLRHLACFDEVSNFLCDEFGTGWVSYVESIRQAANRLANLDPTEHNEETLEKGKRDAFTITSMLDKEFEKAMRADTPISAFGLNGMRAVLNAKEVSKGEEKNLDINVSSLTKP